MATSDITLRLWAKGYTQARVAQELSVSRVMVHLVITGRTTSRRVKHHIAEILGEPVEALWPPVTEITLPQAAGGEQ